jgi:hypothetical protein
MRTKLRSKVTLLFMTFGLLLAIPAVALADNTQVNEVDVDGNAQDSVTKAPGDTGTLTVRLVGNRSPTGDINNCNVDSSNQATVSLTSSNTSKLTLASSSVSISACGNAGEKTAGYTVTNQAQDGDTLTVTSSTSGGLSGSLYNDDTFTVNVIRDQDGDGVRDSVDNCPSVANADQANNDGDSLGNACDPTPDGDTPPPPADTTAPSISYVLNPDSPDGDTGWYKSNVSLTWTVTENESASSLQKTGCVDQNITADQAEQTYSCSASSDGGSAGPVEVKIKRDGTAPVISNVGADSTFSTPNAAGWYNTDVRHNFSATDNLSGFAGGGTTLNFHKDLTQEGSAVTISSGTVSDLAGNVGTAITSSPAYKIDKTAPTVTVTGVANNGTYNLGSVPAAGCDTQDQAGLSGVAQEATVSVTGGTTNGVGTFTATCSGGKDVAGNTNSASVQYKVLYVRDGGILQPINYDNTSVFSRGKAVPVKFKLAGDAPLGFNVSGWTLQKVSVSCTNFDSEDQVVEQIAENPSQSFRYDSSADQYIINADFKSAAVGSCWKARVTLNDATTLESSIFRMQK